MVESSLVTQNETIADEYQITIKQEPITEELEEAPSVDTATNDVILIREGSCLYERGGEDDGSCLYERGGEEEGSCL